MNCLTQRADAFPVVGSLSKNGVAGDPAVGRAGRHWRARSSRIGYLDLRLRRDHGGRDLHARRAARAARRHGRIRQLVRSFRWPPPPDGKSKRWPAPRGRDEPGRPLLEPDPDRAARDAARRDAGVPASPARASPTTAFAHGLAGGIADTRPLGSGVAGRKVFFQFRGPRPVRPARRRRSTTPTSPPTCARSPTSSRATRALGRQPRRRRAVPAARADPGPLRAGRLLPARRAGRGRGRPPRWPGPRRCSRRSTPTTRRPRRSLLSADIPAQRCGTARRPGGTCGSGSTRCSATASPRAWPTCPQQAALPDRAVLAAVTAPALVIGCRGDVAHPPVGRRAARRGAAQRHPAHLRPAGRAVDQPGRPAHAGSRSSSTP